ncbi:MAG TPA: DUF4383 domain-containing protein [Blastocatellia bacterium]|nr:DUF4383 domain-containing protein [Blastocatellia bacterium]
MAKTIATLVGVVFILVGICGFLAPGLLGAHLSPAHNVVHLVSGAASLYFGLKGTLAQARLFCIIFGIVYGLLGVVGLVAGAAGEPGVAPMAHDAHLLKLLPGTLEFGTVDHYIHILIGVLYLIGGFMTKLRATED